MASINGVTLRKVEKSWGHEGEDILRGQVYYNGKCLGMWQEDSHGGESLYSFDTNLLMKPYLKYIGWLKDNGVSVEYTGIDMLILDILTLGELSKSKGLSKNLETRVAVFTVFFNSITPSKGEYVVESRVDMVCKRLKEQAPLGYILPVRCKSDFDIKLGNDIQYKREFKLLQEEEARREEVRREEAFRREEIGRKVEVKERFKYVYLEDSSVVIVEDTYTGKRAEVKLYALGNVKKVLSKLFDE